MCTIIVSLIAACTVLYYLMLLAGSILFPATAARLSKFLKWSPVIIGALAGLLILALALDGTLFTGNLQRPYF